MADRLGFSSNRKLVAICSDDWGGIRLKNSYEREQLKLAGINVTNNRFDEFDTLESNEDLKQLFGVLIKYKDQYGNHPVITAVMNVANPDFEKIRDSRFENYFFEPFTRTLSKYPNHDLVYTLYKQGIAANIFKPQFHGREHLQVKAWLNALQSKDVKTSIAFENEFFFLTKQDVGIQVAGEFADAYNFWDIKELEFHKEVICSGIDLFKTLLGYSPVFFTAPVLIYNRKLNATLHGCGIQLIDVPKLRSEPIGHGHYKKKLHYMGQRSIQNLKYVTRNAVFESNLPGNGVEKCLASIETAFMNKKPAIVSNHRASFVGGISLKNRIHGLEQLDLLIRSILKKWPDVEFVDMEKLNQLMRER